MAIRLKDATSSLGRIIPVLAGVDANLAGVYSEVPVYLGALASNLQNLQAQLAGVHVESSNYSGIIAAPLSGVMGDLLGNLGGDASATIFVEQNGSDAGSGTVASPYGTLQYAIGQAVDGDVIEMRAASPGGTWTYTHSTTVGKSFNPANPLKIRVRQGDTVNMYPTGTGFLFTFGGRQGFELDGSVGTLRLGDRSRYSIYSGQTLTGGTWTYPQSRVLSAESGTAPTQYIVLKGLICSGADGYALAKIGGSDPGWVVVDGCSFSGHGRELGPPNGDSNAGDGFEFWNFKQPFKVINCQFGPRAGGHGAISFNACTAESVFRNNSIEGFNLLPDSDEGYRAAGFGPAHTIPPPWDNYAHVSGLGRALIEDNNIFGTRKSKRNTFTSTLLVNGRRLIFRFNRVYDCTGESSIVTEHFSITANNVVEHMRFYHNTWYNNENIFKIDPGDTAEFSTNFKDIRWQNNIFCRVLNENHLSGTGASGWATIAAIWLNRIGHINRQGYPDHWLGMQWGGNLFHCTNGGLTVELMTAYSAVGAGRETSLAGAQSRWPNVFLGNNVVGEAQFVNVASGQAGTKEGFNLQVGSPGRGDSPPMATVTSNSSTNTVNLTDAWWIYDGFNWPNNGPSEVGDYIAFYASNGTTLKGIRQVDTVTSQTQVVLTASISVVSGDQVYLCRDGGNTVCRNRGAQQA